MKEDNLIDIFLREKPFMLMIELKKGKRYLSVIAKRINCTYSHLIKILNILEKKGLVKTQKDGRLKYLELTKKGIELADEFEKVKFLLSQTN